MEGSCHCGRVRFEAPAPSELLRCNCSFCDRVGAEWAYCPPDQFTLLSDADAVSTYTFNAHAVQHYHCAECGCATHQRSPVWNEKGEQEKGAVKMGYNARMMRDLDRDALPVSTIDGASF